MRDSLGRLDGLYVSTIMLARNHTMMIMVIGLAVLYFTVSAAQPRTDARVGQAQLCWSWNTIDETY